MAQPSWHTKLAIAGTDCLLTGDIQGHSGGPPASSWPLLDLFPTKNHRALSEHGSDRATSLCSRDKYRIVIITYKAQLASDCLPVLLVCLCLRLALCSQPYWPSVCSLCLLSSLKMLALTFWEHPPTPYPELLTPVSHKLPSLVSSASGSGLGLRTLR